MIHIQALPGTPAQKMPFQQVVTQTLHEAEILLRAGVDAIMIENMHDVPYLRRVVGPEISTAMAILAYEVKRSSSLPCGIQILAGANKAALAAALSAGVDFIRAEGFVFAHVADEGIIESDAGELLRYRKMIGAEDILIFTDVKKKHSSHAITADVSIEETIHIAEFFLSNGIILSGQLTGLPADIDMVRKVSLKTQVPILMGSGMDIDNVETYLPWCDGMIVGSSFKVNGHWAGEMDEQRVSKFMEKVRAFRG